MLIDAIISDLAGTPLSLEQLEVMSYAIPVRRMRNLLKPEPSKPAYSEVVGAAR